MLCTPNYSTQWIKKAYLLLGFLFCFGSRGLGEPSNQLDSLLAVYESGNYTQQNKLLLLKRIGDLCNNPDKILLYSERLIQEAKKQQDANYIYIGLTQQGSAYQLKGDYSTSLARYFEAAPYTHQSLQTGLLFIQIGDVFSLQGNHPNAVHYYKKAIVLLSKEHDSTSLVTALYNLGDEYVKTDQPDSARPYIQQAQVLSRAIQYRIGEAFCLGTMGVIQLKKGESAAAEQYLNQSITMLEALNEYDAICEFLISMAVIKKNRKEIPAAIRDAKKSVGIATSYGLKQQLSSAYRMLSELYNDIGNSAQSFFYYKKHIAYRDSILNLETVQKLGDLRTDFEVSQKQQEVNLLATKNKLRVAERNGWIFASLLLILILGSSIYYYTQRSKRNQLLAEKQRKEAEINHQKNLMQTVITSQETERKRIGMDLHDEVGAALSTLRMKMEQQAKEDIQAQQTTQAFKMDIDRIITNMRSISHALSPRISGSYGFYDAIHELADSVNQSDALHMLVEFDEQNLPVFANDQTPMAIYRVISELTNNILKHAQASRIVLHIDCNHQEVSILYSDNGRGIDLSNNKLGNGIGMQNMESRLRMMDATWNLKTAPLEGFQITITIPLQ